MTWQPSTAQHSTAQHTIVYRITARTAQHSTARHIKISADGGRQRERVKCEAALSGCSTLQRDAYSKIIILVNDIATWQIKCCVI
jgi:adenosyl cobinamide kinase/adenosyl cobinamide phosphate guanylyltransferase